MMGFYSIRKLIEANKLTTALSNSNIPVRSYDWRGEIVTLMNWHKLDELYDFSLESNVQMNLLRLCHLIIHSYVFAGCFGDTGNLEAVYFNSDRTRHEALYALDVERMIELFESVAHDDVTRMSGKLDPKTGDWKTTNW
jgi:hypothetical protein